jgi:ribosomal protein S18 acetylase RimI-like enzyme
MDCSFLRALPHIGMCGRARKVTTDHPITDIHFRDAVPADRASVIALWAACGLTRPWNDPDHDFDLCLGGPASTVLVGTCREDVIASALVGHDGHRGTVYYVSVDPGRRGQDLGRLLMDAAEHWLVTRGIGKLNLLVRNENAKVHGFYQSLGYAVEPNTQFSKWLTPR